VGWFRGVLGERIGRFCILYICNFSKFVKLQKENFWDNYGLFSNASIRDFNFLISSTKNTIITL
jgi:hypothetical protein